MGQAPPPATLFLLTITYNNGMIRHNKYMPGRCAGLQLRRTAFLFVVMHWYLPIYLPIYVPTYLPSFPV